MSALELFVSVYFGIGFGLTFYVAFLRMNGEVKMPLWVLLSFIFAWPIVFVGRA